MGNQLNLYEKAYPLKDNWFEYFMDIKQMGFDGFELSIDPQKVNRLDWSQEVIDIIISGAQQANLKLNNIVLSANREYPLGSDDEILRSQGIDIVRKAILLAASLNIPIVQVGGYVVREGLVVTEHALSRYVHALSSLGKVANKYNVILGIENMDRDLITLRSVREIVNRIDSPSVKMYPDVGNIVANQLNIIEEWQYVEEDLLAVHFKDVKEGIYREVDFGDGIVDFKLVGHLLKDYKGPITLEMWNGNDESVAKKACINARKWFSNYEEGSDDK